MRRAAALGLVFAVLIVTPCIAATQFLKLKRGVETRLEIDADNGFYLTLAKGQTAATVEICNRGTVAGEYAADADAEMPAPVQIRSLGPGACRTFPGNFFIQARARSPAWVAVVTFK